MKTPVSRITDVRMLYSPLDAVELAEKNPDKEVVFFAVGFETTIPVYLTVVKKSKAKRFDKLFVDNVFALQCLLQLMLSCLIKKNKVDGFLTAGHVCAITGNKDYYPLVEKYHKPMVVTGFEPIDLLYGIYRCILQLEEEEARENAYTRVVAEEGNPVLISLMNEMLEPLISISAGDRADQSKRITIEKGIQRV